MARSTYAGSVTATSPAPDDIVQRAVVDARPRWRRLLAPASATVALAAAAGYLYAVDPNEPGHYPLCPTQALLGMDCAGCGCLRGTHALLHGDLAAALDHNVLLVVLAPLLVVLGVRWFRRAWRGERPAVTRAQFQRGNRLMIASLVAVLAFGVVRNFVPYLSSGA